MEKKARVVRCVVVFTGIMIWAALTGLCILASVHGDRFMLSINNTVYATFFLLPFILLGGLYGYYISMISFIISFCVTLVFSRETAYNMSIYLVGTLLFSLLAQYMYFKLLKKTLFAAGITLVSTSLIEYINLSLIQHNEYNLSNIKNFGIYFTRDAFNIFAVALFLYILFSKMPDICKTPFPTGIGYTKAFQENIKIQRDIRKTKVSIKITTIIIAVELILGISVGVFFMVLFPDIRSMFAVGIRRNESMTVNGELTPPLNDGQTVSGDMQGDDESESDVSDENEKFATQIENMHYRFDEAALGIDLKMILLMLCVGVPMAAIANYYTKTKIGGSIGIMSDFMYDYANAADDEKLEVGKNIDSIAIKTNDEIEVLYESMKTTVHSIEEYIGRLKEEQELEKELEVAQKASEAKSSFLSNMSHEIRTPINAVLGMNEMILRESSNEQILEYANNIKSAGNSLLGIINDILDFSKIEAGKMDILPVEYHLGSTINDLVNMVASKADDKGLELKLDIDENLPSKLIGDEIRIKQCVTNVLSNAVKYTEEGSVTLAVSYEDIDEDNIYLSFRVVDTGIGIKEEDLKKLYSPFERIEEIRNRSIEGTGLGMSIVKKLLALMDTRLEVKSEYGKGSDFSFKVKQEVANREKLGDFRKRYKEFINSREKYREHFRAPKAYILVVDDTPMNLTVVKGLLKNTQIQIDTAESGFEAIEMVKEKKYDALFIDHRMPEMDGIETLDAMRKLEGNKSSKAVCIALTANAGDGARQEYIDAGFDDYLSKPVDGILLEEMLAEYLPEDKVEIIGDDNKEELATEISSEKAEIDKNIEEDGGKEPYGEIGKILSDTEGINYEKALASCGTKEILNDVLKEFYLSIDEKADNIEKFKAEGDYRNYTVSVHALKSSARLIGAEKLSENAAYLEKCGDEENTKEIAGKTDELVASYRGYKEKLAFIVDEKNDDKPEIPEDELESAFSDMKELLEAYDFDTADGIMNMLSNYRIPDSYAEKYKEVQKLMADVDRDALMEIL